MDLSEKDIDKIFEDIWTHNFISDQECSRQFIKTLFIMQQRRIKLLEEEVHSLGAGLDRVYDILEVNNIKGKE